MEYKRNLTVCCADEATRREIRFLVEPMELLTCSRFESESADFDQGIRVLISTIESSVHDTDCHWFANAF